MKRLLSISALLFTLIFNGQALAAGASPANMTASGAIVGTQIVWCPTGLTADLKCTFTQVATFINSLFSGDCTVASGGAVTCTKTNGAAFGGLATVAPGTGVSTAAANATGGAGGFVIFGGAAGTLTGNVTGNAGTVTTNANLTGAITSVGNAASLGSFSSAQLLAALSTKTGTGSAVFGSAPTIDSLNATTAMTLAFLTGGGTQCLQVSNTGVVSATGSACGSGSAGVSSIAGNTGAFTLNSASGLTNATNDIKCQQGSASQFGCVEVDGSTITATAGVIKAVPGVTSRTVTGATDTILNTDRGNVVYYNSASSIAVTQPAPSGSFAAGFFTTLCNINAGIPTVTPGSGTIINASTYPIPAGISFASASCVSYQSDGTNFNAVDIQAAYGTGVQAALGKATNATGGVGTVGTSGSNVGLLNGTNTFSGVQTFGEVIGGGRTVSGTTDTLAATDCGTTITYSNAGAVTVTVPQGLPSFCVIALIQLGAGKVSTNGSAVTPATQHAAGSFTGTRAQFSVINITNYTTNTVILSGDAS